MHVLIVALHRPLKPTGVCRYAANLARCLAETEEVKRVTLVVGTWQKQYFLKAFSLESSKIFLEYIDIKNNSLSRNIWFLFGLPKLAQKVKPDIVHLSFPLPFWRALFPCPVVATIHDLYPYECPENFGPRQAFFNRVFLQQCIQQSDRLTCVSQATLESLKYYCPNLIFKKPISVIYNIVDFSDITPFPPVSVKKDRVASFLLTVGQHRKNKNLDLLIRAFSLLLRQNRLDTSTKLIIVGSPGPQTDYITQLIDYLSLGDQVLILSSIDDGELCWLYQNCQSFIVSSSTEGFCIPLAEALYLSCKVVCSAIPVFKEIGSETCTYFDLQGDPIENLCQAISQAINSSRPDQQLRDYRFSKAVVARQHLELYCRVSQFADQTVDYVQPTNHCLEEEASRVTY
ncbi:MAG: glycosyltransferase family 4 protein [Synechococcales cyanobacterium C42_A2020_086]|jgi:glycosyltransferase involved in cell wall biosynthesis|nr:glycosyltransferase family 4 protein [Synechococcales cyanobacterium C42_A2020_086]